MTKPTSSVAWATDATFTTGDESGETTRDDPSGLRAQGIYANQRIPARWFNFLFGAAGDWITFLDDSIAWCRNAVVADGADNTGASDTTTALADCIQALDDIGGGVMVLNAGTYKTTDTLTVPKGVSIGGVGQVKLQIDHATKDAITYATGTNAGPSDFLKNFQIEAKQANDGQGIQIDCFCDLIVDNVRFNLDGFFRNRTVRASTDCRVKFLNCSAKCVLTQDSCFLNTGARFDFVGFKAITDSAFNGKILDCRDGETVLDGGCRFDVGASSGGDVVCVDQSGGRMQIDGTIFDDGGGNGNTAISFADGVAIVVGESVSFFNIVPYATGVTAARGSALKLVPSIKIDMGSDGAVTIPAWVASAMVETTNADAPIVTLQKPLIKGGQPLDLIVRCNKGSGSWASALGISPEDSSFGVYKQASGLSGLANGAALSLRFRAEELPTSITAKTLAWVQVGAAGTIGQFT